MKRLFRALLPLFLIFAIFACAPAATPLTLVLTPTAVATTVAPESASPTSSGSLSCTANEFDSKCALAQNQMLAVTIGSRVAGTPNGDRAGNYIAQQFIGDGYAVEKQEFTFEPWEDLGTRLQYAAPLSGMLESQPVQFSPAGHIEASVVAVGGTGDVSDFAQVDVKGKIALVQRGTLQFYDKSKNAADAGAVAILIYNNAAALFGGTMRNRATIPTIALSGREGQKVIDAMKQGTINVRIDSDTQISKKIGHNIIATKQGSSEQEVVLGGHYDTVAAGPGANDNGSGAAVLLELGRVLAQRQMKDTLIFIAFDAEEYGLLGSAYYTDHLSSVDRSKVLAMLNFDMLGGGSGPLGLGGDGTIAQATRKAASDLGIQSRNFQLGNNTGSDHQSFTRLGIDSVFFSRDYDLLHTPQDTMDQVKAEFLAESGRVALNTLMDLQSSK